MNSKENIFKAISTMIVGGIFTGICGFLFSAAADSITRIVLVPFLVCALSILLKGIIILIQVFKLQALSKSEDISDMDEKVKKIDNMFSKLYIICFLLLWFGFLIFYDYLAIKNGQMSLFYSSSIFWIIGVFVAIKNFKQ